MILFYYIDKILKHYYMYKNKKRILTLETSKKEYGKLRFVICIIHALFILVFYILILKNQINLCLHCNNRMMLLLLLLFISA